ncbi:hypothetical protein EMEDMD4_970006 [Sinorhizobium medicae]|uniref:Uncharacterized protein n=1 Tax=Sinorhizobium medicae TaxID=110321 RepID=A0A508X8I3_9HYPH|nr:hypothetical protein EMEDMD4_970006 [Sinorhizobium medicae]
MTEPDIDTKTRTLDSMFRGFISSQCPAPKFRTIHYAISLAEREHPRTSMHTAYTAGEALRPCATRSEIGMPNPLKCYWNDKYLRLRSSMHRHTL